MALGDNTRCRRRQTRLLNLSLGLELLRGKRRGKGVKGERKSFGV